MIQPTLINQHKLYACNFLKFESSFKRFMPNFLKHESFHYLIPIIPKLTQVYIFS
jgi:hypothetical protein